MGLSRLDGKLLQPEAKSPFQLGVIDDHPNALWPGQVLGPGQAKLSHIFLQKLVDLVTAHLASPSTLLVSPSRCLNVTSVISAAARQLIQPNRDAAAARVRASPSDASRSSAHGVRSRPAPVSPARCP